MQKLTKVAVLFGLTLGGGQFAPVSGAPALWETNLGSPLPSLAGQDTATQNVALSFAFPFAGASYGNVYVGVDGYLNLGSDAGYPFADPIPSDLLDSTSPLIAPFFTDIDLIQMGSIHFNDLGNRAVFTWAGVGSWAHPDTPFTFQAILHQDGRIAMSYMGIPDTLQFLDTNLLTGVSPGGGAADPGAINLSSAKSLATGPTAFELFEGGSQRFDLDGTSLLFTRAGNGFVLTAIPEPSSLLMLSCGLASILLGARRWSRSV